MFISGYANMENVFYCLNAVAMVGSTELFRNVWDFVNTIKGTSTHKETSLSLRFVPFTSCFFTHSV